MALVSFVILIHKLCSFDRALSDSSHVFTRKAILHEYSRLSSSPAIRYKHRLLLRHLLPTPMESDQAQIQA